MLPFFFFKKNLAFDSRRRVLGLAWACPCRPVTCGPQFEPVAAPVGTVSRARRREFAQCVSAFPPPHTHRDDCCVM